MYIYLWGILPNFLKMLITQPYFVTLSFGRQIKIQMQRSNFNACKEVQSKEVYLYQITSKVFIRFYKQGIKTSRRAKQNMLGKNINVAFTDK